MSGHSHWHAVDWALLGALIVVAGAYLVVARRRRRVDRDLAFVSGWLVLAIILPPPLHSLAGPRFWMHMVQLELLTLLVPPLLLFSAPLDTLPRRRRAPLIPRRNATAIVAALLFAIVLWTWHMPSLYQESLATPGIRVVQHASLFLSALWLWDAVLRRAPGGIGVLCILATMIHMGLLGALLTLAPAPLYAGVTLQDQQLGGLIMWVPAGFVVLLKGLWTFDRWLESQS